MEPWIKGNQQSLLIRFQKEFRLVEFTTPKGNQEEFILFGQKDWSIVLPITKDKQVIYVTQFKQGCNKIIDELPAGTAFGNESPYLCMNRELLEETGYMSMNWTPLGDFWMNTRSSWTQFHCFLALDCEKKNEPESNDSEEIEVKLVPFEKWIEMCHTVIEEPSSIVCTFRALKHI